MTTWRTYRCMYCGARKMCSYKKIPLQAECIKSPYGVHDWRRVE